MFRMFRKEPEKTPSGNATIPQAAPTYDSSLPSTQPLEDLPLRTEPGGLKGFPLDISVIYYHDLQGLLCLGTKNGSLYIYGDGFQFFRPSFMSQNNEIMFLLGLSSNQILVVYSDNSLVLFDLPTLQVINFLDSDWLAPLEGDITSVAHDVTATGQTFVYLGTSRGVLRTLECTPHGINPCDFFLLFSELHVSMSSEPMELCEIKVSPKEEKYLLLCFRSSDAAIAYSDPSSLNTSSLKKKGSKKLAPDSNPPGAVVLYDLLKLKTKFSHPLSAPPSSAAWYHTGDFFWVSTLDGLIHLGNMDKQNLLVCWRSSKEVDIDDLLSDTEEPRESDSDQAPSGSDGEVYDPEEDQDYSKADLFFSKSSKDLPITRIAWLPPQGGSLEGCLMVLISSGQLNSKTILKNVLVGLSPSAPLSSSSIVFEDKPSISSLTISSSASYNTIIRSVYGVSYEFFSGLNHSVIQDFILVPTANKEQEKNSLYPGILLLTNSTASCSSSSFAFSSEATTQVETNLMLVSTPKTNNVSEWSNHLETLKSPREVYELFPSASTSLASTNGASITCFHAFSSLSLGSCSDLSLSKCLMKSAEGNIIFTETPDEEEEFQGTLSPAVTSPFSQTLPQPPKRRLSSKTANLLSITAALVEKSYQDSDEEEEDEEGISYDYTNLLSSLTFSSSGASLTGMGEPIPDDGEEIILAEGVFTEASQYHAASEAQGEEPSLHQRQQDIAVLGQDDGLVKIYGVSLPDFRREVGKGCLWCPIATIDCNAPGGRPSPISHLKVDEGNGLMLVGTKKGGVVLLEVYDDSKNGGSLDLLKENSSHVKTQMKKLLENEVETAKTKEVPFSSHPAKKLTDFLSDEKQKHINFSLFSPLDYKKLHKVFHIELKNGDCINNSLLLGQHQLLFLTTQSGKIYYINKFSSKLCKSDKFNVKKHLKLLKLSNIPQYGGLILFLKFSYFKYHKNILPCLYIVFGSGHIIVVNILTMEAIAWSNIPKKVGEKQLFFTENISELVILNKAGSVIGAPLYNSVVYMSERAKCLANVSVSATAGVISPPPVTLTTPPPQEEKKNRFSFFRKKEDVPSPIVTSPGPAVPQASSAPASSSRISIDDPRFRDFDLITYPSEFEPHILSFYFGNNLICMPISSFTLVGGSSPAPPIPPASDSVAPFPSLAITAPILKEINFSNKKIIASQLFYINDDSSKSSIPSLDKLYWAFLDQTGWLSMFSLSQLSPCGKIKIFETLLPYEEIHLGSSSLVSILPNGNIFALVDKHPMLLNTLLVYSESLLSSSINYGDLQSLPKTIDVSSSSSELVPSNPEIVLNQLVNNSSSVLSNLLPHRAFPSSKPPSSSQQLFYGLKFHLFKRADASASSLSASSLSAPVAAKKKRASVVISSLTKSELDLSKLMTKPRDQKIRAEYSNFISGSSGLSGSSLSSVARQPRSAKSGADAAIGDMNEAKRLMMANAEKLDLMSQQSEELGQNARAFRDMTQQMKNDIQKKNNRWGLF